eukprot:Sspe_Gene.22636::Locus_8634_Transcript_1_1_Confidence_1.000_Length_5194::g.22636::m.22636
MPWATMTSSTRANAIHSALPAKHPVLILSAPVVYQSSKSETLLLPLTINFLPDWTRFHVVFHFLFFSTPTSHPPPPLHPDTKQLGRGKCSTLPLQDSTLFPPPPP